MLKQELLGFFKGILPFALLADQELEKLLAGITMEYFPRGTMVLSQNGPACRSLHIVKKGGVKIYLTSEDKAESILDYCGEGDFFDIMSLMSGDHSRINALVEEDAICYLLAGDKVLALARDNVAVNEYLFKSCFAGFLDRVYDETRKKIGRAPDSERVFFTTPVCEIVRAEPITVSQEVSIREGAGLMVKHRISSLIVAAADRTPIGIVTDRDLREKVVAASRDVEDPLKAIMSPDLFSIDKTASCFEALIKMMRHKTHHVVVLDGNRLHGMITNHDFMVVLGSSPATLVKEISAIRSLEELKGCAPRFYKSIRMLLRNGARAHNITGLLTELSEQVINSSADLIEQNLGPPPAPYCLFIFEDGGRRELGPDFRISLGIAFKDQDENGRPASQDFFARLAEELNRTLGVCLHCRAPLGIEPGDIRSLSAWQKMLADPATEESCGQLARFIEMRPIRGSAGEVRALRNDLAARLASSREMLTMIAAAATKATPPLGFSKQLVVEKNGEHQEQFNLYDRGIRPLVEITRLFALQQANPDISSSRRLQTLEKKGVRQAAEIARVLDYLQLLLIQHQLRQIEKRQTPDCSINPDDLSNFEKRTVKESFRLIEKLHATIREAFPV